MAFLRIAITQEQGARGPFLIVAPLTTMDNWKREVEKWTDFKLLMYYGEKDQLPELRAQLKDSKSLEIVLTTYEKLRQEEKYLVHRRQWNAVIFDEGHKLKTINSNIRNAAEKLHCNIRIIMTGTPITNVLKDLWALLNYVDKKRFASFSAFESEYLNEGNLASTDALKKLQEDLKSHMLARKKSSLLTKLPKEEILVELDLVCLLRIVILLLDKCAKEDLSKYY